MKKTENAERKYLCVFCCMRGREREGERERRESYINVFKVILKSDSSKSSGICIFNTC